MNAWFILSVHLEAAHHTITDCSLYMFVFMRLCCSPCDGAISRLTVSQSPETLKHTRTLMQKQHTHFISHAPTSNLHLASGNTWERLAF